MITTGLTLTAGAALVLAGTLLHRAMERSPAYVTLRHRMGPAGHEEA